MCIHVYIYSICVMCISCVHTCISSYILIYMHLHNIWQRFFIFQIPSPRHVGKKLFAGLCAVYTYIHIYIYTYIHIYIYLNYRQIEKYKKKILVWLGIKLLKYFQGYTFKLDNTHHYHRINLLFSYSSPDSLNIDFLKAMLQMPNDKK